jgi:HEAT repeat protein
MRIKQAGLWVSVAGVAVAAGGLGCQASQGKSQNPASASIREPAAAAAPAAPVAAAPSPARSPDALKKQIIEAMSGYEHIVSKEELERMGTGEQLTPVLLDIYNDPSVHLAVRTNALASLRFFPSPQAKAAMEKVLMSTDTSDVVRRSAIRAYGSGFGDAAVPMLARFLSHPELHTRNITARTLGDLHTPDAVEALRKRLPQEGEPMVRKTIETGLAAKRPALEPNPAQR